MINKKVIVKAIIQVEGIEKPFIIDHDNTYELFLEKLGQIERRIENYEEHPASGYDRDEANTWARQHSNLNL